MLNGIMEAQHSQQLCALDSFGRKANAFGRKAERIVVPDQSGRWFWRSRNYNEVALLLPLFSDILFSDGDKDAAEELMTKVIAPVAAGTFSMPLVNPHYASGQRRAHKKRIQKRLDQIPEKTLLVYKVTLKIRNVKHGRPLVEALERLAPLVKEIVSVHSQGSTFRVEIARTPTGRRTCHVHGIVLVRAASEIEKLRREWAATVASSLPKYLQGFAYRSLTHASMLGVLNECRSTERHGEESVIDAALGFLTYAGKALQGNSRQPWIVDGQEDDLVDLSLLSEHQGESYAWIQSAARVNTLTDILAFSEKPIPCAVTTGVLDGRCKLPGT